MQESAERSPEPHPQDVSGDRNSDRDPSQPATSTSSCFPARPRGFHPESRTIESSHQPVILADGFEIVLDIVSLHCMPCFASSIFGDSSRTAGEISQPCEATWASPAEDLEKSWEENILGVICRVCSREFPSRLLAAHHVHADHDAWRR